MTGPTPGSPQQAGAEIVRRCGNCEHARERLGSTVHIVCKCDSSPEWGCIMEHVDTCDHWRKRGAE